MTLSGNGDHILRQIAALRLAYHGDKIPKRKAEDRETFEALHKAGLITDRGVLTEKGRGEAGALPMEVEVITLIKVSHSEIDRFISSRYGHEFEAVLDQGAHSGGDGRDHALAGQAQRAGQGVFGRGCRGRSEELRALAAVSRVLPWTAPSLADRQLRFGVVSSICRELVLVMRQKVETRLTKARHIHAVALSAMPASVPALPSLDLREHHLGVPSAVRTMPGGVPMILALYLIRVGLELLVGDALVGLNLLDVVHLAQLQQHNSCFVDRAQVHC